MMRSMIAFVFAALALAACQSDSEFSKSGATAAEGVPMGATRFSDVPLPQGIKEDLERSYVYESATLQVGRMVYAVDHRVAEVAQFYLKEAPNYQWRLVNVLQAEGAQLNFSKPGKQMWVNVTKSGTFGRSSRLVIHVIPDGQSARASSDLAPLR